MKNNFDQGKKFCFFLELENNFKTRIEEHVRQLEKEKDALIDKLEEELRARQKIITETTFEDMNNQIKEIRSIFVCHQKFFRLC